MLLQFEKPRRTVRCYYNGRVVYEVRDTTEDKSEIQKRAAVVYAEGDMSKIHPIETGFRVSGLLAGMN